MGDPTDQDSNNIGGARFYSFIGGKTRLPYV